MSTSCDVTVVVPTVNRAELLEKTLQSLVSQTAPCRLIVIDDGSQDATPSICKRFRSSVEYVCNERTLGLFANWNRGISLVETQFAAIYHDDDLYHPDIVASELALLRENPELTMVHTGFHLIDDQDRVFDTFLTAWPPVMSGSAFRHTLAGLVTCPVATPSVMFRVSAIRAVGGFDDRLRVSGDLAAWFALAGLGDVGYVRQPLVSVRIRGRYANSHATFDWGLVDEHLTVATSTLNALHARTTMRFRARASWYLTKFLCRELISPSGGDPMPVIRHHAGRGLRKAAPFALGLSYARPLLLAFKPVARNCLESFGRLRGHWLARRGSLRSR